MIVTSIESIPPGEGRTFEIKGQQIAIFRGRNGQVYATEAECPHKLGPLADGLLGGSTLVCPLHSWKWDLNTGDVLQGDCPLRIYPVRVEADGKVSVELDPK